MPRQHRSLCAQSVTKFYPPSLCTKRSLKNTISRQPRGVTISQQRQSAAGDLLTLGRYDGHAEIKVHQFGGEAGRSGRSGDVCEYRR